MDTIKRCHTFGNPEKFKIERAAIHKGKNRQKDGIHFIYNLT